VRVLISSPTVCLVCSDQLDLYMQGQEKAILDDNETEDHDPTTNVIGPTHLHFLCHTQATHTSVFTVSNAPGNPGNLLELFFSSCHSGNMLEINKVSGNLLV